MSKLEKILECPICLETYKCPKVLPCQHSFCLCCIYQVYLEKIRKDQKCHCPLCNREIVLKENDASAKKNKKTILTLEEFKKCLADNLTLIELNDVLLKPAPQPSATPRQNVYKNGSQVTEQPKSNIIDAAQLMSIDKPKPVPRSHKPPPPDPPVCEVKSKVRHRLSVIPEEKAPPAHPLRRLPNAEIKMLLKLEPEIASVITTRKLLLDSNFSLFISFAEENAGIRKYSGIGGDFLMKFAATGTIIDFGLDQKSAEIVCIVCGDANQTYLQSYDSENGQRLKCLRYFTAAEMYRLIACNKQNRNEFVLAGPQQLATYNSKQNAMQVFRALSSLPDLKTLIAMDCSKTGTLYLLFADQPKSMPIMFGLSLASSISFSLPIYSDDMLAYRSFSITANNYYVCDFGNRCIHMYRKIKPDIAKSDASTICKSNYYNWKPELVFVVDKKVFVYDSEKKAIYQYDDKQAV